MATKNGNTAVAEKEETLGKAIELAPLVTRTHLISIVGLTPLILNRWSEKAKLQMSGKQQGKAQTKKPPKDPEADYQAARYLLPDGRDGMPSGAFKAAIVNACSHFDGVTKVLTKQAVRVEGVGPDLLVPIVGEISMREDMVRNATGVADIRYRPQFWPWSTTLVITYVASALSESALISLLDAAGFGGVGEWRPSAPKSASGSFGMFKVARND